MPATGLWKPYWRREMQQEHCAERSLSAAQHLYWEVLCIPFKWFVKILMIRHDIWQKEFCCRAENWVFIRQAYNRYIDKQTYSNQTIIDTINHSNQKTVLLNRPGCQTISTDHLLKNTTAIASQNCPPSCHPLRWLLCQLCMKQLKAAGRRNSSEHHWQHTPPGTCRRIFELGQLNHSWPSTYKQTDQQR